MYGYIYKTTNLINGKIYIGQHKHNANDKYYYGSGHYLWKAIEKYGIENFKCEIIEECENREQLNEREKYWIAKLNTRNNKIGYNALPGGEGGSLKGRKFSKSTIEKFSKSQKDMICINNGVRHIRVKRKNLEKYLNDGWKKGLIITNEYRKNMSKAIKGRKFSNIHKLKLKENYKKRTWVTNDIEEKHILNVELDEFLKNNSKWRIGKKRNKIQSEQKIEKLRKFHLNKIVVYKNGIYTQILKDELDEYIKNGWIKGGKKRTKQYCEQLSKARIGRKWVTNDVEQKWVYNYNEYIKQGWRFGKKKKE